MLDLEFNNPFYQNYLFTKKDIARKNFTTKLKLVFSPMYSQMNDGYIYNFKIASDGAIYLFSYQDDDL